MKESISKNVGVSDSLFVGLAEELPNGILDGRNEGTEDVSTGENDGVGADDVKGGVVGKSDPFSVGGAEGFPDIAEVGMASEGIRVFSDVEYEGTEDSLFEENVAVGKDDIEGDFVGKSDPFCVGRAEGFSDGIVDRISLEGVNVFVDGRNEGTGETPSGKNGSVVIDDIEGEIVGMSDSLYVGGAEGIADICIDGLKLEGASVFIDGRNEGTTDTELGDGVAVEIDIGAEMASWVGVIVTLGEGARVFSTSG